MTEETVENEESKRTICEPLLPLPFTLEILKLIKDYQQQHGLRHGDYQRYRGYCSRRIARLRKVLKLPQGDRRHYKKRDVQESHICNPKSDDRFLHLCLVLAERCWAYAMQLRQEANTEPRKKFHLVQKLRKACGYALHLQELCKNERCDARTKLEAQAYTAWMHGSLQFELHLWLKAVENLKQAQVIYEKLATTLPENEQAPYRQRVEEITPSIRYCSYNIGDDKAVDLLELRSQGVLENFEALVLETKQKTTEVLHQVQWFNVKVSVTIERVRLFLISIEGLDESLNNAEDNQAKIKILENLFIDLRDIISLTRDNARNEKINQILLNYLISIRIERTAQRNLLLIQQSKKPQDCVRLLDINIQQFTELAQNETIKEDPLAQEHFSKNIDAFKCLRTYYLGKGQAHQKHWKESALLFDITSNTLKQLTKHKYTGDLEKMLQSVVENVETERIKAQANYVLETSEQEEPQPIIPIPQKAFKSKKPLIDRLDEFHDEPQLLSKNPNLITLPGRMEPVPVKPLFFDLALNFVQFPDLSEKLEVPGGSKPKQGGGISGLVKGLWGWGNK